MNDEKKKDAFMPSVGSDGSMDLSGYGLDSGESEPILVGDFPDGSENPENVDTIGAGVGALDSLKQRLLDAQSVAEMEAILAESSPPEPEPEPVSGEPSSEDVFEPLESWEFEDSSVPSNIPRGSSEEKAPEEKAPERKKEPNEE